MRPLWTSTMAVVLAMSAGTAYADGLLYQLPEDGSWVSYDIKLSGQFGDRQFEGQGTLTMKSVGQSTENGEPCRWIEFRSDTKFGERERTSIYKLLIPEKFLKKGEAPLDHLVRGWRKFGDGEPEAVENANGLRTIRSYLVGPLPSVKKLDKEVVESKLGRLECDGLTGQTEYTYTRGDNQSQVQAEYRTRLHKQAPFGVVSCQIKSTITRDGEVRGTITSTLKLADFGTTALTELPKYK